MFINVTNIYGHKKMLNVNHIVSFSINNENVHIHMINKKKVIISRCDFDKITNELKKYIKFISWD